MPHEYLGNTQLQRRSKYSLLLLLFYLSIQHFHLLRLPSLKRKTFLSCFPTEFLPVLPADKILLFYFSHISLSISHFSTTTVLSLSWPLRCILNTFLLLTRHFYLSTPDTSTFTDISTFLLVTITFLLHSVLLFCNNVTVYLYSVEPLLAVVSSDGVEAVLHNSHAHAGSK